VIADRPLREIDAAASPRTAGGKRRSAARRRPKTERAYKTVTQYSMGPIEENRAAEEWTSWGCATWT
jgi:hypothetical protein